MPTVDRGFAESERAALAALYWEAFGTKLGRLFGPETRALAFVEASLSPSHALVARVGGCPVGLAGFRDFDGSLVDMAPAAMLRAYGPLGTLRRSLLLALRHRDTDNRRFLVDGLAVAESYRGQGIGTRLVEALAAVAAERRYPAIRLDVADGNLRARALYDRLGFRAVERIGGGRLDRLAGGTRVTVMERPTKTIRS